MSIDLSLDRLKSLLPFLPYTRPTLHIAGTNGKGSVSALLTSILLTSSSPLRIGRFNSPHLVSVLDSITIDDVAIDIKVYTETRTDVEAHDREQGTRLTSFELLAMTALRIFETAHVDVVVLEVGMGGLRDATNIVPTACIRASALAAVDLDHQAFLGDTVALIAREKAGIARNGRPFILGRQQHGEVQGVVEEVVREAGGTLLRSVDVSTVDSGTWSPFNDASKTGPPPRIVKFQLQAFPEAIEAQFPLQGAHQLDNLGTALGVIDALLTFNYPDTDVLRLRERITPASISAGIAKVKWRGRLSFHSISVPGPSPLDLLVLADGAHNPASAKTLGEYITSLLENTTTTPIHITYILSLSHSPPKTPLQTLSPILPPFPGTSSLVPHISVALLPFSPPEGMPWVKPVALSTMRETVQALVPELGEGDVWLSSENEGLKRALEWAAEKQAKRGGEGLVVLAGSLYLVADFYRLLEHGSSLLTPAYIEGPCDAVRKHMLSSTNQIVTLCVCTLQVTRALASLTSKSAFQRADDNDTVVYTPSGPLSKSKTHQVTPGAHIEHLNSTITVVSADGITVNHLVPFNQATSNRNGLLNRLLTDDNEGISDGYAAYFFWSNTMPDATPLALFTTTWTVPPSPAMTNTSHLQTIFLFNALQPAVAGVSRILQPVLQYGTSAAGGGAFWSVASWYVANGTSFFTPLVRVESGQVLEGILTLDRVNSPSSAGDKVYSYTSLFAGIPSSALSISSPDPLSSAWEVLEIYNVTRAVELPQGRTQMHGIQVIDNNGRRPDLHWVANVGEGGFGAQVVVDGASNGEVDIVYPLQ
ncbi:Dihydrofolate synthetase [Psilocybe cubensis]|uniref:Dihydrofolate synthetase n=3 Tax=Psilocybe cubensis TaxID=181762 RepID=A0ACB8GP15_PSICU|nr:Dihydrofolate synthetase [Psilocybe cubensis]KAH9477225.1 Dihydrofolate synthetase [Psilocybe cubensis]